MDVNHITGDRLTTGGHSGEEKKRFDKGWELIFGKKEEEEDVVVTEYVAEELPKGIINDEL